jgi:protein ImuA
VSTPSPSLAASLAALRARLHALAAPAPHGGIAFGDAQVDACLPDGGLPLGALHEVTAAGIEAETGALAAAFAASWLGRLRDARPVLWIAPGRPERADATLADLNPAGLLAYGLDPARLLLVQTEGDSGPRGSLAAMEAALRGGAAAAVVAEVGRVSRLAARRLHLACLAHGSIGFLLRRFPYGRAVRREPAQDESDAASVATRWHLTPAPSDAPHREPGAPRWQVELRHARGGRPGAWLMEVADADREPAHPLRVVAGLADAAPAPDLASGDRRVRAG